MFLIKQNKQTKRNNSKNKYKLFFKAKAGWYRTKIPECGAKRHRNRHRTMCVCIGKFPPDRTGRLPLTWFWGIDYGGKIFIGLEDSPRFRVWILLLCRGSQTRLCRGLTQGSFIIQGQTYISLTHSSDSSNQNFDSIYNEKSLSLEIKHSKTADQKFLSLLAKSFSQ